MNVDIEPAGALMTAGLAASEIEGDSAEGKADAGHPANCANCKAALAGQFCHSCGQRAHIHRSLLHLGEEFLHGLLHFDAKAWRTLPMLVARPGQLTRRYVNGERARFVSPLALFLFMIFLMFFMVSMVGDDSTKDKAGSGGVEAMAKARAKLEKSVEKSRDRLARAEAKLAAAKAEGNKEDAAGAQSDMDEARGDVDGNETAKAAFDSATGSVAEKAAAAAKIFHMTPQTTKSGNTNIDTGSESVDAAIKHALDNPELTLYKLKNSASKFSFLLVPISLPFLWLLFFWKRGFTMYDHAVFVLYSLSFMAFLVVVLAGMKMAGLNGTIAMLACFVPPIHMFMQLRGTYALGVFSALWRTMALLFVSGTVFMLYMLLILVLSMR